MESKNTTMEMNKPTDTTMGMSLPTAMEHIYNMLKIDGFDMPRDDVDFIRPELEMVKKKLDLTAEQTMIFLTILENSFSGFVSTREITDNLQISNIRFLGMSEDIQVLKSKRYIRETKGHRDRVSYKVPNSVIRAIQENRTPTSEDIDGMNNRAFFRFLYKTFRDLHADDISAETAYQEIIEVLIHNENTNDFLQKLKPFKVNQMERQDQLIAFYLFHRMEAFGTTSFTLMDFSKIELDSDDFYGETFESLTDGSSPLFSNGILENACDDGEADMTTFELTDKVKSELMKGIINMKKLGAKAEDIVPEDELIKADKIEAKDLYFNEHEEKQIQRLEGLLEEENFKKIGDRLEEKGLSRGVTVLFYGAPGTGKTASVLELARRSGRDLYFVDQSKLRSKWNGESEKQLKGVFDNYRQLVEESKVCPILVLNECDTLMNRRTDSCTTPMEHLNNSMINIILNELDDFKGILLTTSNLTKGMDPAFERRLLFKVQFKKPDKEVRQKIWESKIGGVTPEGVEKLSDEYEFSGGQIDNVARKANIDYILTGSNPSLESLEKLCADEKIKDDKKPVRRIGF